MSNFGNESVTPESNFCSLVQIVARLVDVKVKLELSETSIYYKTLPSLLALFAEDGVNQRQLGSKLNFPDYLVSRHIDALIKAEYAERRPDPSNRRSVLIFITDSGREKTEFLTKIIELVDEEITATLTENERTRMIAVMRKVIDTTE